MSTLSSIYPHGQHGVAQGFFLLKGGVFFLATVASWGSAPGLSVKCLETILIVTDVI